MATKLASGERSAPLVVEAADVRTWLGRPHFFFEPVAARPGSAESEPSESEPAESEPSESEPAESEPAGGGAPSMAA